MKYYESLSEFVRVYFSPNQHGFDDWTIIKATMLPEKSTVLMSLANPLQNEFKQVSVAVADPEELTAFRQSYREHYAFQFDNRFGFFMPERRTGDIEYESFELFDQYWIEAGGRNILPYNIPLLIDYPDDLEYAEASLEKTIAVNYQRLIICMAQPRKRRLKTIFVQNMTESDFADIRQRLKYKMFEALGEIF